jgi:hypothetical protein
MTISSPEREAKKVKLRLIAIQLKQVSKMGVDLNKDSAKKDKLKGLESNSL